MSSPTSSPTSSKYIITNIDPHRLIALTQKSIQEQKNQKLNKDLEYVKTVESTLLLSYNSIKKAAMNGRFYVSVLIPYRPEGFMWIQEYLDRINSMVSPPMSVAIHSDSIFIRWEPPANYNPDVDNNNQETINNKRKKLNSD